VTDQEKVFNVAKVGNLAQTLKDMAQLVPKLEERLTEINSELVQGAVADAHSNFYRTVPRAGRSVPTRAHSATRRGRGSITSSRDSMRAVTTGIDAKIVAGGPSAPSFFGHEFGGGRRPTTRQFPAFKGATGYVLYPAIRKRTEVAEKQWLELAESVIEEGK